MQNSSRRRGKLICFIGIDGSGKTTLAKGLIELMETKGVQYKYVYGRLEPFILKPFIIIGRIIFFGRKKSIRIIHHIRMQKGMLLRVIPLYPKYISGFCYSIISYNFYSKLNFP